MKKIKVLALTLLLVWLVIPIYGWVQIEKTGYWLISNHTHWKTPDNSTYNEYTLKFEEEVTNFTAWEFWFKYDGHGLGYGERFFPLFNDDIHMFVEFKVDNGTHSLDVSMNVIAEKYWWWWQIFYEVWVEFDDSMGFWGYYYWSDSAELYRTKIVFYQDNETDNILNLGIRIYNEDKTVVLSCYDGEFDVGSSWFNQVTLKQYISVDGKGWIEGWKQNEVIKQNTVYNPDLEQPPSWLDILAHKIWNTYKKVIYQPLPDWAKKGLDFLTVTLPKFVTWITKNLTNFIYLWILITLLSAFFVVLAWLEKSAGEGRVDLEEITDKLQKIFSPFIKLATWITNIIVSVVQALLDLIPF